MAELTLFGVPVKIHFRVKIARVPHPSTFFKHPPHDFPWKFRLLCIRYGETVQTPFFFAGWTIAKLQGVWHVAARIEVVLFSARHLHIQLGRIPTRIRQSSSNAHCLHSQYGTHTERALTSRHPCDPPQKLTGNPKTWSDHTLPWNHH